MKGNNEARQSNDTKEPSMKKRHTIGLGIALATAAATMTIPAAGAGAASGPSTSTIADVLLSDSAKDDANGFDRNWRDYDIVTQAVLLFPDLVEAASNPAADLTVLAPNDQAFRLLAQELFKKRYHSEADVLGALATLGLPTVKAVLTYHIVGAGLSPATVLASDNVQVATLGGGTFGVDVINKRKAFVQFVDGDPNARNAFLNKINVGGGELANGYIHGIDRVLRPIDL
jgi:uncharacterized surface protein with fasciclin (FAS1) repeats